MSLRKTCHICVYLIIFISSYLFLEKIVREWNLNRYYYGKLERYHKLIWMECRKKTRNDSTIDWAIGQLTEIEEQMRQDHYTRAETHNMSQDAMLETLEGVDKLSDEFWEKYIEPTKESDEETAL